MVEDEDASGEAQDEPQAPPSHRKPRWPLVLIALVVLGAGIGGYFWFAQPAAPDARHAKTKSASTKIVAGELYLALQPPFVVNFRDDDSMRYLQVGITLMAHDQAAIDVAKNADPVIRDAMVSLLSSQDSKVLSSAAGREKLQAEALAAVQKVVRERLGKPGIQALYFTSFVMQ